MSVMLALPIVLFATHWMNPNDPKFACRVPMVRGPWVSNLVLCSTLSEIKKWTLLGGLDSTMHMHFIISPSEEQEEMVLISGASVKHKM